MAWTALATQVAVLGAMLAAPLSLIVFYLKSVHDTQAARQLELARQIERIGERLLRLGEELSAVQRNYATKEEWLRESLLARSTLKHTRELLWRALRASSKGPNRLPAAPAGWDEIAESEA